MFSVFSSAAPSDLNGPETWPRTDHTLFLRIHSAEKLQLATTQSTYCKVYMGEAPVVNASHSRLSSMFKKKGSAKEPKNRSFHSSVSISQDKTLASWDKEYEVPVEDIKNDILSIRVKSKTPVYPLSIGSCAIQLEQLRLGTTIEQGFPLFKGKRIVGSIRLQLTLRKNAGAEGPVRKSRTSRASKAKRTKAMDSRNEDYYALEEEHTEFLRRQREQEQQLIIEKQRIEEKMEQLRREEEDRSRRRAEKDKREAERVAAADARVRRSSGAKQRQQNQVIQEQEDKMVERFNQKINRRKSKVSTREANASFEDQWRTPLEAPVSSAKGQGRSRRPALALTDIIDSVVHDALPSDSENSDHTDSQSGLDTEDEQEFIREIARLKLKMIQKRKQKQVSRDSRTISQPQRRSRTNGSVDASKGSQRRQSKRAPSSSTSSVASSSSSDEAEDEDEVEDADGDEWALMPQRQRQRQPVAPRKKNRKQPTNQADHGFIQSMTPGQISQKTGQDPVNPLTLGQIVGGAASIVGVAVSVTSAVAGEGDMEFPSVDEACGTAVGALKSLVPVGRFVGQKLHEASAMVAQFNGPSAKDMQLNGAQFDDESSEPTYYV